MKISGVWKTKRRLWQVAAGVLLILSLVLSHVYKAQLLSLVTDESSSTQVTPPPCNLNQSACLLPIITPVASEAPWTFSVDPRPIPVSAALTFTLSPPERMLVPHIPSAIWIDLTGESMDMGIIRINLQQQPDGQWIGTGSIPICISGSMRWRARVHMVLEKTTLQADWIFTAPESSTTH